MHRFKIVLAAAVLLLAGSVACSSSSTAPDARGDIDANSADLQGHDLAAPDGGSPDVADLGAPDSATAQLQRWVKLLKGSYSMGSPNGEACVESSAEMMHQVTLTHDYEIQTTEVTQDQYKALLGESPSQHSACGGDCPVERVDWSNAAFYCNALSVQKGLSSCYACSGTAGASSCMTAAAYGGANIYSCPGYRLPTEAEWEVAYRAGTATPYYSGFNDGTVCKSCTALDTNLSPIGWYCANSGGQPHPVGRKQKNSWGLWDLPGNVAEWCHDWAQNLGSGAVTDPWGAAMGLERVVRGGSYQDPAQRLRAADRNYLDPQTRQGTIGFRCVRSLDP